MNARKRCALLFALAAGTAPEARVPARPTDGEGPPSARASSVSRSGRPPSAARPDLAGRAAARPAADRSAASAAIPQGLFAETVPLATGWTRVLDPTPAGHDYGYGIAADAQGNVYVCGELESAPGDWDVSLVKLDRHGNELWRRTWAGSAGGRDIGWHVVVDPAGSVVVQADSVELAGGIDMTLLKYDPQGNLLWVRSYDGPGSGYDGYAGGVATAIDASGDVLTIGTSWGGTSYDLVCLKVAANGALLWERRLDTGGLDDGYGVVLDAAGNAYVIGDAEVAGSSDFLTLKLHPDGTALWMRTWDSPYAGQELVYAVNLDGLGNVLVTGTSWDFGCEVDISSVTYDADGNLRWSRQYGAGNGGFDLPFWIVGDGAGNVAVAGLTQIYHLGTKAAAIYYDARGTEVWSDVHIHPSFETGENRFTDAEFDAAGNLYVVGPAYSGAANAYDCQLVVYSPAGQRLGDASIDLGQHGVDHLSNLFQDPAGRLYATGHGLGAGGNVDTLVIKLAQAGLSIPPIQ